MRDVAEPTVNADRIGKIALRAFLALLIVNALVAIAAILGASGDAEWEILGTTLLLTAGCLTVAANARAIERDRLAKLPHIGAGLSCFAFAVLIFLIWNEPSSDADLIWKPTLIALTLGLAATYASLLSIPPLTGAFSSAQLAGYCAVGLLAAITCGVILAEEGVAVEIFAVLSVVLATASIIVLVGAVVHRRASAPAPAVDSSPAFAASATAQGLRCPRCTTPLSPHLTSGSYTCHSCGLGFGLQV